MWQRTNRIKEKIIEFIWVSWFVSNDNKWWLNKIRGWETKSIIIINKYVWISWHRKQNSINLY